MDGSRGIRAAGTDGNDFEHRQKIDNRYEKLANAKSFISTTGIITLVVGIWSFFGSFIDSNIIGIDYGVVFPLVITSLTTLVYLLSTKVSSSVVDVGTVALYRLLCQITLLLSFGVLFSIFYELFLEGNFNSYFMFASIPIYLFNALISHRSAQTADEIVAALETKKGKGKH